MRLAISSAWLRVAPAAVLVFTLAACDDSSTGRATTSDGGFDAPASMDVGNSSGGAGGTAGTGGAAGGQCLPMGVPCAGPDACCSRVCQAPVLGGQAVCGGISYTCAETGAACGAAADCCGLSCQLSGATAQCSAQGACVATGADCQANRDCCSNRCDNLKCAGGSGSCLAAGAACTDNGNCCSKSCSGNKCEDKGNVAACRAAGDGCTSDGNCCSGMCDQQTDRCLALPWCRPAGEPCSAREQCCGLVCNAGFCQSQQFCRPSFEVCENDRDCCSFRCARDEEGFKRCLPAGGCRTSGNIETSQAELNRFGEICNNSAQCCSGKCTTTSDDVMRCEKAGDPRDDAPNRMCLPHGEICETDKECCTNYCDRLQEPDGQGHSFPKRCLDGRTRTMCLPDNTVCADSGECCTGRCTQFPNGQFRCGVAQQPPVAPGDGGVPPSTDASVPPLMCVPALGSCTQTSDCCLGLACAPYQGNLICVLIIE